MVKKAAWFTIVLFSTIYMWSVDLKQAEDIYESAKTLEKNHNVEEARDQYDKALEMFRELGAEKQISNATYKLGSIAMWRGDFKNAEKDLRESLTIKQQLGFTRSAAVIENRLAYVLARRSEFADAEQYAQSALRYRETEGDSLGVSGVLNTLGVIYIEQSAFPKAENVIKRALAILKTNPQPKLEKDITVTMGLLEYSRGNYGEAMKYYKRAEEMSYPYESQLTIAEIQNNLGTIYNAYHKADDAKVYYRDALKMAMELQNKDLESRVLNNLAGLHLEQQQYDDALDKYQRSLEIKRSIGNKRGQITTLKNIGNVYMEMGNSEKAREFYQKALDENDPLGFLSEESRIYFELANLDFTFQRYESATLHLEESISIAERLNNLDQLSQNFHLLARIQIATGKPEEAEKSLKEAIENIEQIRSSISVEEHRSAFISKALDIYRDLIQFYVEKNENLNAYTYYERMKARNLLDIIEGAFLVFDEDLSPEEIEHQQKVEAELRNVTREISFYALSEKPTRDLDSLVIQQRNLKRAVSNFKSTLFLNHPDLQQEMGEGEPIDAREALHLLNSTEAALAYMVVEKRIYCFVMRNLGRRKQTIKVIEIELSREQLDDAVRLLTTQWKNASFKDLYGKLIEPVTPELEGVEQLCIIPDRTLNLVPFQALKSPETNEYLIDKYTVYYAPSMSVLQQLRTIGTKGKEQVLAFGNPYLGEAGVFTIEGSLSELPATEDEVKAIQSIYQTKSKVFLREQASEENFNANYDQYGVLHFASHGVLDEVNPMFSSIVLTIDEHNDGFLTAREILKKEMNSDLVILSACNTAKGDYSEGEGLLGLSRAFFGALVPSVVASLWSVDDQSTRLLMENFYRYLKDGVRPARALRQAQLDLKNQKQYSNPYFWAPFILIGDTE